MNIKRAWVDQDLCGAFQLCIGEFPSHFEETEGIASRVIATDSPFTASDLKSLVSGAWSCPLGAIYIELENGEILNEITEAQYVQYVKNS